MEIRDDLLKALSFPDFAVEDLIIDRMQKKCELLLEGAYLDSPTKAKELPSGVLYVNGWEQLSVTQFEPSSRNWISTDSDHKLRDLCEAIFDLDVTLRGFSPINGLWTEYKFTKPREVRFCYE